MLRLCAQCGEDVPEGGGCTRCGAPEPCWEPEPLTPGGVLRDLFAFLASAASGLMCLLAAFAFLYGWIGPGLGQRILQVVVGLIVVGAGVPVGLGLLWSSVSGVFERRWVHREINGRSALATTRLGRLVSASGGGRFPGPALTIPGNDLSALEAFAQYGVLRTEVPTVHGLRGSPPRVDVSLLATLLSLAGRHRLQLRVTRDVSWSRLGEKLTRHESPVALELRRTDALPGAASADFLAARLLDALEAPTVTVAQADPLLPYRAPAAVAETSREAPWVRLPQAIFALSKGDPRFRRETRVRLESMLPPAAEVRSAEAVCAELTAMLEATGDPRMGGMILRQIELGFAMRAPAPAG
jgi:hypothetical protein